MIKSLRIKNLATIEDLELELQEGFSILTGETGAGKSIIIEGIRLAIGEKGSQDMIRTGERETSVEAILPFIPEETFQTLASDSENEIFVQRKISEQGPGKGYVNGTLVPVKKLREIGQNLVDIYGQNDHVFLLNLDYQMNYLDAYADALSLRKEVSQIAQELRRLIKQKNELESKQREREHRLDFLDFQIREIEKALLRRGEEEELRSERDILKNAEKIGSLVEKALDIAYNQENSIASLLAQLQNAVSGLKDFDRAFQETEDAINQFSITVQDFADFLIRFKEKQSAAPEKLEDIEERLSQIEKLKRKYGGTVDEILSYLNKAEAEFETLGTSQEKLADLDKEIEKKFSAYKISAEALSNLRKKKALELGKQVEKEISLLGMKKARFKIKMETSIPGAEAMDKVKDNGTEEVEFLISPNPGEDLKPLRKIASGGELSRVMLALKAIGKEMGWSKTLIFDEIDSGIGGKTAEFVAQKLKKLSSQHQIICITHLPQIASFAVHHYKIDKKIEKDRTYTTVKKLNFEERVTEIARLLAGSRITETALQNAREMLIHNLG